MEEEDAQAGDRAGPAEEMEEEEEEEELTKEERRALREQEKAERKANDSRARAKVCPRPPCAACCRRIGALSGAVCACAELREAQNADIEADMDSLIQKRLEFISKQTDLLLHFDSNKPKVAAGGDSKSKRGRMTEKAEDELLMKRAETEASGASVFADDQRLCKQPSVLQNGTLRDYQLEGLNWMVRLYHNGKNSEKSVPRPVCPEQPAAR